MAALAQGGVQVTVKNTFLHVAAAEVEQPAPASCPTVLRGPAGPRPGAYPRARPVPESSAFPLLDALTSSTALPGKGQAAGCAPTLEPG